MLQIISHEDYDSFRVIKTDKGLFVTSADLARISFFYFAFLKRNLDKFGYREGVDYFICDSDMTSKLNKIHADQPKMKKRFHKNAKVFLIKVDKALNLTFDMLNGKAVFKDSHTTGKTCGVKLNEKLALLSSDLTGSGHEGYEIWLSADTGTW